MIIRTRSGSFKYLPKIDNSMIEKFFCNYKDHYDSHYIHQLYNISLKKDINFCVANLTNHDSNVSTFNDYVEFDDFAIYCSSVGKSSSYLLEERKAFLKEKIENWHLFVFMCLPENLREKYFEDYKKYFSSLLDEDFKYARAKSLRLKNSKDKEIEKI
ncbi:MAG: hypothetical protein WCR30_00200 [Clostridia bacterium]